MSVLFDPTITKFVPRGFSKKGVWNTYTDTSYVGYTLNNCPSLFEFERNNQFNPETYLTEPSFNWGQGKHADFTDPNTGERVHGTRTCMLVAFKLMVVLGFRTIFIVGADFHMDPKKPYAFDEDKHEGGCRSNNSAYRGINIFMRNIRPHLEQKGVSVYNTFENSGLKAFDYVPFDEAIAHALQHVGDPVKEMTNGMYDVRKRHGAKNKAVIDNRVLEGHYKPPPHLDLLALKGQRGALPSQKPTIVAVATPKAQDLSVTPTAVEGTVLSIEAFWEKRNEVVQVFPDMKRFKSRAEQRVTQTKSRACKGCKVGKYLKTFMDRCLARFKANPMPLLDAEIFEPNAAINDGGSVRLLSSYGDNRQI
jgi:hypothetical protein